MYYDIALRKGACIVALGSALLLSPLAQSQTNIIDTEAENTLAAAWAMASDLEHNAPVNQVFNFFQVPEANRFRRGSKASLRSSENSFFTATQEMLSRAESLPSPQLIFYLDSHGVVNASGRPTGELLCSGHRGGEQYLSYNRIVRQIEAQLARSPAATKVQGITFLVSACFSGTFIADFQRRNSPLLRYPLNIVTDTGNDKAGVSDMSIRLRHVEEARSIARRFEPVDPCQNRSQMECFSAFVETLRTDYLGRDENQMQIWRNRPTPKLELSLQTRLHLYFNIAAREEANLSELKKALQVSLEEAIVSELEQIASSSDKEVAQIARFELAKRRGLAQAHALYWELKKYGSFSLNDSRGRDWLRNASAQIAQAIRARGAWTIEDAKVLLSYFADRKTLIEIFELFGLHPELRGFYYGDTLGKLIRVDESSASLREKLFLAYRQAISTEQNPLEYMRHLTMARAMIDHAAYNDCSQACAELVEQLTQGQLSERLASEIDSTTRMHLQFAQGAPKPLLVRVHERMEQIRLRANTCLGFGQLAPK